MGSLMHLGGSGGLFPREAATTSLGRSEDAVCAFKDPGFHDRNHQRARQRVRQPGSGSPGPWELF